jgi:2-octaprenylphenol hydroxylase
MSAPRSRDFDVLIVGAGVIGATMANLLLTRGACTPGRVALIADRFAPPPGADWDLRVFALSRAAERLLDACGVWRALPVNRICAYERMCVWDESGTPGGRGSLSFDCAEIGEPNLGFIVDAGVLAWQSLQAARAAGAVTLEAGIEKIAADTDGVTVRLTDGRELTGTLLIGADGTESRTRALLGIETAGHAYQQDALVAHVRTARPHGQTARQRFLGTGPLALLPLADGRSSIVWSTTRAEAARLRALSPQDFGAALESASGAVLGEVTLTTTLASFPLKLQYATEYVRPRAVLLGDAAHVVHPLAGQGLNLGLLDCATLTQVLASAGGAQNFGDLKTLRRYERWRRSENLLAAGALDGLERLFSRRDAFTRAVRSAGLDLVGRSSAIRQRLARRALGLIGDLP